MSFALADLLKMTSRVVRVDLMWYYVRSPFRFSTNTQIIVASVSGGSKMSAFSTVLPLQSSLCSLRIMLGAALAVSLAVSSMTLGAKTCTGNQSLVQPGARLLIGAAAGNFLTAYLPESVLTERCLNRSKEEFLSLYGPPHCKSGKPGIMKVRIKGEIQYVDPVFLWCSEAEIESDEFWHYRTGEFDGVVIGFKYGKAVFVKEEHRLHMEVVAK